MPTSFRTWIAALLVSLVLSLPSARAQNEQAATPLAAGRGFLGVMAGNVQPPLRGALIQAVMPNGPAQRGGLQPHDLVIAVDGRPIGSATDLTGYVASKHPGDQLAFSVLRWNGQSFQPLSFAATLDLPPQGQGIAATAAPKPPVTPGFLALPAVIASVGEAVAQPPALPAVPAPPPVAAAPGSFAEVTWTSFSDPLEQAFTTEVPQGWTVAGGVVRKVLLTPNLVMRLLSPDRRTFLAIGDPDNLNFSVPTQLMASLGIREGQLYTSGPGSTTIVSRFVGAPAFASRYAETVLGKVCADLRITGTADRPDFAQRAAARGTLPNAQLTGAEASFTCRRGQLALAGGSAAVLFYVNSPQHIADAWGTQVVAGFVTTPDQEEQARQLLGHVIESVRENPTWTAEQVEIARRSTQGVHARWAEMERQFQAMDDIITNTAHYIGPGGQRYDLEATHPYQWLGPNGVTMGTDAPTPPPGLGWTMLQRVPQ